MSDFLAQNLTRIRHTPVVASIEELQEFQYEPSFEEIRGTVASVRLDTLLALAFSSSRSRLSGLIEGKKVFVNGRMIVSNGYRLKEGDIILYGEWGNSVMMEFFLRRGKDATV